MLKTTFIHLPGVGPRSEARLWANGIRSWEQLARGLRGGITPKELVAEGGSRLRRNGRTGIQRALTVEPWLGAIETSLRALEQGDFNYFAELLPTAQHWRILAEAVHDALYLDIETTGLSRDLHALTIVGALHRGRFYQWAWPEAAPELSELLSRASLVVTFNGTRFDIPFLQHHMPALPRPRLHIDLRYVAAQAGLKGGLKAVEQQLGLIRPSEIVGVDGAEAVSLWCRTLYGDRGSYRKLLGYNRADVVMLRTISERLAERMSATLPVRAPSRKRAPGRVHQLARRAATFECVQSAWQQRHTTIASLAPAIERTNGRMPVVVGIDLRGKSHNPTGMASCVGSRVEHAILYDDDSIFDWTIRKSPDLVSIDAPLSLPRGRRTAFDDDPTRKRFGIVRDAERILWRRGIRVYPALIPHMQTLTARGIVLARRLQERGIDVIESYPGAAQDVLGIPRKRIGRELLARGLRDFGFDLPEGLSHDELDAVTSALVGYFYVADRYEGLGAADENFLIVPRPDTIRWSNDPWPIAM